MTIELDESGGVMITAENPEEYYKIIQLCLMGMLGIIQIMEEETWQMYEYYGPYVES